MDRRSSRFELQDTRVARVSLVVLAMLALGLVGCASLESSTRHQVAIEPHGPGAIFTNMEDAVVDAMAFSVIEARRTGMSDRMHGGVITRVSGGFTYDDPIVAESWKPLDLRYTITGRDVARFHVYPRATEMRENQKREHVTRWDRVSVDKQDPHHRSLYFLTPSLVVKVYGGNRDPVREVARLDRVPDRVMFVAQEEPELP